MADALSSKVRSCDNPWQTLLIKYGNNRGKLFTEEALGEWAVSQLK